MRGMNSETVDLIYLDPPFNSKTNYAAPIGSQAAGAEFKDMWSLDDIDVEWIDLIERVNPQLYQVLLAAMTDSDKSYLVYMATRLLEMPRLLKPTGSIYLHCDPTMSHYLKLVMDAIFGRKNFRNEIVWCYPPLGRPPTYSFPRKHDVILFFSKSAVPSFAQVFSRAKDIENMFTLDDGDGRLYRTLGGRGKYYLDEYRGRPYPDWWDDIPAAGHIPKAERTGFKTQKPLALLDRIVRASSNEGDVVFDPFCGCATSLVAADRLGRRWIGVDLSEKSAELVVQRIEADQGLWRNVTHLKDVPHRTDLGPLPKYNSRENRQQLYGQQSGYCAGCSTHFESRHLEVDHIIAVSKGGTDHISNLQLLCGNCNRVKGNRGMDYLRNKLRFSSAA